MGVTFRLFAGRWGHSCQDILLLQRLVFRILHVSQQIVEEVVQLQNTQLIMIKSVLHKLNLSKVVFRWISELCNFQSFEVVAR